MDTGALEISELVVEACARIDALEHRPSTPAVGELEHLRAHLLMLADETDDHEAADAARGVIADIDAALEALHLQVPRRGAA